MLKKLIKSLYLLTTSKMAARRSTRHTVEETDLGEDSFPHVPVSTRTRHEESTDNSRGLEGDYGNVALLLFLYLLQGIPLGVAGSVPMLLQSRSVSYKEQAVFSFVFWPFSLKLIWAPLVDSLYLSSFGRRKSWLVPIQYLIGVFMVILSFQVDSLIGRETNGGGVSIYVLTAIFFMLNFLAATQDIAVDGWALTMLSRRNVGWASTCNSVGQTAGYFLGNILFLALESADFCNKYLRHEPQKTGVVTLAGFMFFWGIVFFVTTTLVMIMKHEADDPDADSEQGIVDTYKQLVKVIRLPPVISYAIILLTVKIGFAAADSMTGLKLIEAGMKKETLALFAIPMIPIQIILPLIISKYTAGPTPMDVFLRAMPFRLLLGFVYAFMVWMSYGVQTSPGVFPASFYAFILIAYAVHQVALYSMFVSSMAFHAKISDPAIGGTYMTLLNTLSNLGGNWPSTLALWLVDGLTWKECIGANGSCENSAPVDEQCTQHGGACKTTLDGYYIESLLLIAVGFLWYIWRYKKVKELDRLNKSAWKCS
ncbi:acetyl-coenzyme A transporter 1-like [Ostrea edulis]|uniref:acetyl-coenzyme A transporter 1-like n=1 Tax=Ostrea edulis TaxID=37623 RepID=UPI0020956EFE|nr:acetyl-coenzyme A transporter 1-like [Ostrea edulis]XP_056021976.1 acetyl-coenzyme A transporter 1-like [Ostrea edulis]